MANNTAKITSHPHIYGAASVNQETLGLTIELFPDFDFTNYIGTQEMLVDELLIPEKFTWPERYKDCKWEDGGFEYRLRRIRPKGAKGSRKDFESVDWWLLRRQSVNERSWLDIKIAHKKKELEGLIRRQTPNGRRESIEFWKHYHATREDFAYQAFKDLILDPVRPRRTNKSQKSTQAQEAHAVSLSNN